jgi:hypothetical protein
MVRRRLPAVSPQPADAILSMAESDHKPSRAAVVRFAEELTNGLAFRELPVKPGFRRLACRGPGARAPTQQHTDAVRRVVFVVVTRYAAAGQRRLVGASESAGIATYRFKESVERARRALIALGLADGRRSLAEHLRSIGKEVQGPEDMPAEPFQRI